jgi:GDP/UDP-N,N'-diacetylbacillosamine 2-epimerase (hydrolysing)
MRLLFLTGSRGEWGYIRPILERCKKEKIHFDICATNMHLLKSYGQTEKEIQNDGFKISDRIYMALDGYNHFTMAKSMGIFMSSFSDTINRIRPTWLIIAGDRAETFMASIVASYTYTPVAHIQAGELSGNIDGMARHAIGKLSHIHFAANKDAATRLKKLGEEDFRIKLVGAPQLDDLKNIDQNKILLKKIFLKQGVSYLKNYILVIYHPVTNEFDLIEQKFRALESSLKEIAFPKIWIMPNNDAGSDTLKDLIVDAADNNIYFFDNLPRQDYLHLLKNCKLLIGNSSSGIIESTFFKIPVINLGSRQNNRVRAKNVLDVKIENKKNIIKAYKKCLSKKFINSLKKVRSLYGDGESSKRILDILKKTNINSKILSKNLTY